MNKHVLLLLTLLLPACPHGALKSDTARNAAKHKTPLLDAIPQSAVWGAILRKGAMTLLDDFYALHPGLKKKLEALYMKRLGVDLSQTGGVSVFALEGTTDKLDNLCIFYHIPTPKALKGKPMGMHRGVPLLAYPRVETKGASQVMAAVSDGLLVGPMSAVKAAIDRLTGSTPRISASSPLGELRYADRADTLLLFGLSKSVLATNPFAKRMALEGATLSYDSQRRLVLRLKGKADQLNLLEKMLNGYLALQLQKLGEKRDEALAKKPVDAATNALLLHHLAVHYGTKLAPVVEDGRVVSRLQLPKGDQAMAVGVLGFLAAALPALLKGVNGLNKDTSTQKPSAPAGELSAGPKVPLQIYIMSKCPYGVTAMQGISKLLQEIGPRVDFSADYIVTKKQDGTLEALHGVEEVKGNIVQLCARDLHPRQSQWLPFFDCVNATWRSIPGNWEQCATHAQLNVGKMRACIEGQRGPLLLRASAGRAKNARASGSPTIYIGGKEHQGGRSKDALLRALCAQMKAPRAQLCSTIPEPISVTVTVLNDKRCKTCGTTELEKNLRGRFFPKLVVKTLDYNTKAGKRLYRTLRKTYKRLPIWIFGAEIERTERYKNISRWMRKQTDGRYVLKVPATFDPTAEICDNKIDDTRNGKVDCKDPSCKKTLLCRKEKKHHLQVFVMSQCPFAAKGLPLARRKTADATEAQTHTPASVRCMAQARCRKTSDSSARKSTLVSVTNISSMSGVA
ncbi:MAG: hypothetical protein JRH20_29165 [Deltaproteobacteria bacterium]|nr:hypothetical protein [Deltaproteobacteria bacterium]